MPRNIPEHSGSDALDTIGLFVPHPGVDPSVPLAGEITAWYLSRNDEFAAGDLLYQITWPGLVVDVSAETSGILTQIQAKLRDRVEPGQQIAFIQFSRQV